MAVELWRTNEAMLWYEYLENNPDKKKCIFFLKSEINPQNGRCIKYPYRGLICRLFGFSAVKNKEGTLNYSACSILKKEEPLLVDSIKKYVSEGNDIPFMKDYHLKLMMLFPELAKERFHINEAIKKAIEKVGFLIQFAGIEYILSNINNPSNINSNAEY